MAEIISTTNFFELFQIPQGYAVDERSLAQRYRELQRQLHPDRFADAGERERRLAVQRSSLVNEAYKTLSSPVARADYLLALAGVESRAPGATFQDPEFLMQQIQLREELAELRDADDPEAALDALYSHLEGAISGQQSGFAEAYAAANYEQAQDFVARLQFLQKLRAEAELLEEELLDY